MLKWMLLSMFYFFSLNVFSQVDTIWNNDGGFSIIDLTLKNSLTKKEEYRDIYVKEERTTYNKEGKKVYEYKYIDGINHYIRTEWNNLGIKTSEEYADLGLSFVKETKWFLNGQINDVNFYTKDFWISTSYYDDSLNSIKSTSKWKRKISRYDSLLFVNKIDGTYWVEQESTNENPVHIPIGKEINYHSNGKIESEGFYMDKLFYIYESKENYLDLKQKGMDKKIFKSHLGKCKDGEWFYFDKDGKLVKKEIYKNCELNLLDQ